MALTKELLTGACPHCSGDGKIRVVNPAWLRERRKNARVTMREMAKRLSYSAAYLCDVEHGRRNVSAVIHDAYKKLGPMGERKQAR